MIRTIRWASLAAGLLAAGLAAPASAGTNDRVQSHAARAPTVAKARKTALRRRSSSPHVIHARVRLNPVVPPEADRAAPDRLQTETAKEPVGVTQGMVHYDHAPPGLSTDVSTFGLAKKF